MKFTIELDHEKNPDAVGEFLRTQFFAEERGCYSCFDWAEGVEPLPEKVVCSEIDEEIPYEDLKWTRGKKKFGEDYIECRYFWEGDGTLAFLFPDGSCIMNDDCKKDHEWNFYEEFPRY